MKPICILVIYNKEILKCAVDFFYPFQLHACFLKTAKNLYHFKLVSTTTLCLFCEPHFFNRVNYNFAFFLPFWQCILLTVSQKQIDINAHNYSNFQEAVASHFSS